MNIITDRPVIENEFSNYKGENKKQKQPRQRGKLFQNLKNVGQSNAGKAFIGTAADLVKNWAGKTGVEVDTNSGGSQNGGTGNDYLPDVDTKKTPEPMSTTKKVLIGVGITAALAIGGYFIWKSTQKGTKTTKSK